MQGATTSTPYLLLPLLSAVVLGYCLQYSRAVTVVADFPRRPGASVVAEVAIFGTVVVPLLAWRDAPRS